MYLISSLEKDIYNNLVSISKECEIQYLCYMYKGYVKEILVNGSIIKILDEVKNVLL